MKTDENNISKNDNRQNHYSEDENYWAISKLLKVGEGFNHLLMLFDIIVEIDSKKPLFGRC